MSFAKWRDCKLGDVLELKRGYDLPASNRSNGIFPVVSSSGTSGSHSESKVKAPGVVTGRYGTIGKVFFVTQDFWPLNTTLYVRDFKGNHPRFISYLLRTIDFHAYSDKGAVPGVNRNHLHEARIRLPDLSTQKQIADILGCLDDKIELNRKMNETLEQIARTLFKSWFIDFNPVRAKAEGKKPFGMDDATAALFPDGFEQSELGEIPRGWRVGAIEELANIVGGSTPSTKETAFWADGIHNWVTPRDLSALAVPVLLSTERRITDTGLTQIGSGLLPVGTVLLSSRAPIGYVVMTEIPVAINQGFIAMIPKEQISSLFLLLWTKAAHNDIVSRANGSTFLEISKTNFRPIPLAIPPKNVMAVFDHLCRPLYDKIVLGERESRLLSTLRDLLMPRLLSGELSIGNENG